MPDTVLNGACGICGAGMQYPVIPVRSHRPDGTWVDAFLHGLAENEACWTAYVEAGYQLPEQCAECHGGITAEATIPVRVLRDGRWLTLDLHTLEEKPACWRAFDGRGRMLADEAF